MTTTHLPIRVYFEDTDFSGVVYHANYLRYFERGRTEGLRHCGYDSSALIKADPPIVFVVRDMNITFHKPAHMDDELVATTILEEIRGARMIFRQALHRGGDLLVDATVTAAAMSPEGRPRRLPPEMRSRLLGEA